MSCASRKKRKRKTRKPLLLIKGTLLYQLLNLEYKGKDDDEDLFEYFKMFLTKE